MYISYNITHRVDKITLNKGLKILNDLLKKDNIFIKYVQ